MSGAVATQAAILHPNVYYLSADWSSLNNLEYWNKGNVAKTINNNPVNKTIYSTSSTSFVEPKTAAFTGFTPSGGNQTSGFNVNGAFNKGWNFYCQPNATGGTIFFFSLGYRDFNNGTINVFSSDGYYWSAGPSDMVASYAKNFGFNSSVVNPQSQGNRAYGLPVRPVSE